MLRQSLHKSNSSSAIYIKEPNLDINPYVLSLEPGNYYFCACGRSANLPYCDGSHRGSTVEPFNVVVPEPRNVAICACGRSAARPFCDGSHNVHTGK
ncbi:MAG: CDGSH iron-sulfur domain-containing protein [Acidiferrobacterales bacterium]